MRRLTAPGLLIALLALGPAPVRAADDAAALDKPAAEEWKQYDRDFAYELVGLLRRLKATKPQSAFLDRRQVKLRVTDRSGAAGRSVRGSYDGQVRIMYLDVGFLLQNARGLRARGYPAEEAGKIMAWKMLPTVAHELSHGLVDERREKIVGDNFWRTFLEDETLAYADEGEALRELFKERGELWERDMILDTERYALSLVRAWDDGLPKVEALARRLYAHKESVFTVSRRELYEKSDKLIKGTETKLAESIEMEKHYRTRLAEGSSSAPQSLSVVSKNIPVYKKILARERPRRKVWARPERFEKLKEFYRKELKDRDEHMRRLRK